MTELQQVEHRFSKLIEDLYSSLQREMQDGFDRLDSKAQRDSGMLIAGTLAIGGLRKWARGQDAREKKRDSDLRDLRERVQKLERSVKPRRKA